MGTADADHSGCAAKPTASSGRPASADAVAARPANRAFAGAAGHFDAGRTRVVVTIAEAVGAASADAVEVGPAGHGTARATNTGAVSHAAHSGVEARADAFAASVRSGTATHCYAVSVRARGAPGVIAIRAGAVSDAIAIRTSAAGDAIAARARGTPDAVAVRACSAADAGASADDPAHCAVALRTAVRASDAGTHTRTAVVGASNARTNTCAAPSAAVAGSG